MDRKHELEITTVAGNSALIYALPFKGDGDGLHRFNDHSHARNFIKYLFSQSAAHPETKDTRRNLIREFDETGNALRAGYNTRPDETLRDFLGRRLPSRAAHKILADDGCYPFFIIKLKDQPIVSNFVARDNDGSLMLDHPLARYLPAHLEQHGHNWDQVCGKINDLIKGSDVHSFEAMADGPELHLIEDFINAGIREMLGAGERVVLTAAHRDQEDHNPCYHVHRLIRIDDDTTPSL